MDLNEKCQCYCEKNNLTNMIWSIVYKLIDNIEMTPKFSKFAVKPLACSSWLHTCPVLVRLFPRPSRSIHFGDVSEENARETALLLRLDHVTRKALTARNINAA